MLVNVNFPDCRPEEVKGIAVTAQGRRRQERLHIDERKDGRGNPYYWIAYARQNAFKLEHGTDIAALDDHCIAVTPLRIDITDEPTMTRLAKLFRKRRLTRPASAAAASMACASASTWNGFCSVGLCADRLPARRAGHSRWRTRTARRAAISISTTGVIGLPLRLTSRMAMSNSACFGERQGFLDAAGFRGDGMAEIGQHAFEQHADHQLVLDHEDALARRLSAARYSAQRYPVQMPFRPRAAA